MHIVSTVTCSLDVDLEADPAVELFEALKYSGCEQDRTWGVHLNRQFGNELEREIVLCWCDFETLNLVLAWHDGYDLVGLSSWIDYVDRLKYALLLTFAEFDYFEYDGLIIKEAVH